LGGFFWDFFVEDELALIPDCYIPLPPRHEMDTMVLVVATGPEEEED
jgi:hypothetical protein